MSKIVKISEFDEKVVDLYVKGYSRELIAKTLEVPLKEVNKVFKKDNIKQIIEDVITQKEVLLKGASLTILEQMLQEKLKNAKNVDDLLNKNKDVIDIILAIDKISKETEKKRLGTSEGNVVVNILNQLMENDNDN